MYHSLQTHLLLLAALILTAGPTFTALADEVEAHAAPIVSDAAPIASDAAPIVSDAAPIVSDAAPIVSEVPKEPCGGITTAPVFQFANPELYNNGKGLRYTCEKAYESLGPTLAECVAGNWKFEERQGRCIPRTTSLPCGGIKNAPTVPFATATVFRSLLVYKCRTGFRPEGSNKAWCTKFDIWKLINKDFKCERMPCGGIAYVPKMPNATPIPELTTVPGKGKLFQLKCNKGYEEDGDMRSVCVKDIRWSRPRGKCIKSGALSWKGFDSRRNFLLVALSTFIALVSHVLV